MKVISATAEVGKGVIIPENIIFFKKMSIMLAWGNVKINEKDQGTKRFSWDWKVFGKVKTVIRWNVLPALK